MEGESVVRLRNQPLLYQALEVFFNKLWFSHSSLPVIPTCFGKLHDQTLADLRNSQDHQIIKLVHYRHQVCGL